MSKERNSFKKRWAELQKSYRMVIINPETFEEISAYVISKLGVILAAVAASFLLILLTVLLIFYTPIREFVPGYQDVAKHPELLRLNESFRLMEEELQDQRAYTENFRKILLGDFEQETDAQSSSEDIPDSLLQVKRIEEDELLRKEIELDRQIQERAILANSGEIQEKELSLDQSFLIPPVSGMVSAGFDPKIKHFGSDITAPKNTPVKSVMEGYVFLSDWTLETGHTLGIQHRNNLISFYKHNSALLKKSGDLVKSGEAIAIIGNTGTLSSGPHLHFELWYKGVPVNPQDYLNFE